MRIALRTILLLISAGILVLSLLPPRSGDSDNDVEIIIEELVVLETPTPTAEPPEESPSPPRESGIVRDMLGGAQIDAGLKAKEVIGEVNEIRQRQIEGLE